MSARPTYTVPVAYATLRESAAPVAGLVTRFGGQPVWLDEPRWPLSATDGTPMRFVAQVALDPRLFGGATPARMAYVFLAEDDPTLWTDGTYAGVDGALVLQPGGATDYPHVVMERGPSLVRLVERREGFLGLRRRHEPVPCEYAVELDYATEPELRLIDTLSDDYDEDVAEGEEMDGRFAGTKVAGTPAFIQDAELPFGPPSRLVLQIADDDKLFALPLGDVGSLYAFMDPRGVRGGLVIQSH